MENLVDVSTLSADELIALAETKRSAENEAKQAEVNAQIVELEAELKDAEAEVKKAKATRKEIVSEARKVAKVEGDKAVNEAQDKVDEINTKIRDLAGKPAKKAKSATKRTKSIGWGANKRNETVLAILNEIDGPASPTVIVEKILAKGLFEGKESSLTVGVSAALNELATAGDVTKNGRKRGVTFTKAA